MKVLIEVMASGEEADKLRLQIADKLADGSKGGHDLLLAEEGQTLLLLREDGRLRPAYLPLKEFENLPQLSIIKVQVLP